MKCKNCKASKHIKDNFVCNVDRLFNHFEILKCEILKTFKIDYKPKIQCRFADLVEIEKIQQRGENDEFY